MDEAEVGRFGPLFWEFLERVVRTARSAPAGAEALVDRTSRFVSEKFRPFEHATINWP
jgi:hypothetical protein